MLSEVVQAFDQEIKFSLRSLAVQIERLGPKVEPFTREALRNYALLSHTEQLKVQKNIDSLESVLFCYRDGKSDTRRAAKCALDKYQLRARDEDLGLILQDDIVEMYSIDGIQIFRNLEFFNYCRYSLLEVMMYEWFTLYERASFVEKDLHQWQVDVLTGALSKPCPFGENFMRERLLDEKRLYAIQFKHLVPLFDEEGKNVEGLMLTSSGRTEPDVDISNLRFI